MSTKARETAGDAAETSGTSAAGSTKVECTKPNKIPPKARPSSKVVKAEAAKDEVEGKVEVQSSVELMRDYAKQCIDAARHILTKEAADVSAASSSHRAPGANSGKTCFGAMCSEITNPMVLDPHP